MSITILDHPLAGDLLTILRDERTEPPQFRQIAERLGYLLVAEALSDMGTDDVEITTPLEPTTGKRIDRPVVAVAVLRAGLGLLHSVLTLVPDAAIGFAGVQRNEETAEPMEYYTKFPALDSARVLILEPMLATGGSLSWAIGKVKENGARDIVSVCVVAAPEGVKAIEEGHPDVRIVSAALDRELNPSFYIAPGLGDMGDRLFGTL
ncbi:MAG TPA: uracil phosphoribosyltransferase [Acidimicrobiia bacterium]|jgi:uracil phosphoribosyltransferase|nr:uracil phosphoribosyltransferase [Acidimicrobiia bacterium]